MKILNFGSLNLDHVYTVPRFVAAGETLSASGYATFCGGKGLNQSVAAARAGATVWHAGMVGQDGAPLAALLAENGVQTGLLGRVDGPSGHAIIQVDETGQNCIIIYGGANVAIPAAYVDEAVAALEAGDILLLQNETARVAEMMERAHARGAYVAFNPSPVTPELANCPLHRVRLFVVNEIEGQWLARTDSPAAGDILDGLAARFPAAEVVLTMGRGGAWYQGGGRRLHHGIYDVPVVDTTAAGDTFCGYFLAGVAAGLPPAECLARASRASSIAVSRPGAAPSIPALAEVLAARLTPAEDAPT